MLSFKTLLHYTTAGCRIIYGESSATSRIPLHPIHGDKTVRGVTYIKLHQKCHPRKKQRFIVGVSKIKRTILVQIAH